MLEELKVEDIDIYTDLMTHEGNIGLFFHLPGHCAGCKRALGILEKKDLSNWKILLVNADIDDFKTLVHQFDVTTAPSLVYKQADAKSTMKVSGLRNFLEIQNIFD